MDLHSQNHPSREMKAPRSESQQDILFEIIKKINSSMDVDEVLHAIVDNIRYLYPSMTVDLWLTHDSFSTSLPFKTLSFQAIEEEVNVRAFMEGRLVVCQLNDQRGQEGNLTVAVPLRGKQGAYGVLELHCDHQMEITEKDIEYITILADSAGNAFENAQLYQQSQKYIRELLLINGITKQLNCSLNLKEILDFVLQKLIVTYQVEYCAIFRKVSGQELFMISASTFDEHNGMVIDPKDWPWNKVLSYKEAIIDSDLWEEKKESYFLDHRSLLGVPLVTGSDIEGAIFLSDRKPHAFSFDDFKLLEVLAQHVNLAIKNASLHNEVQRMVITDNLTGLYNRKYLNEHVMSSLKQDKQGALILMDIDHFKRVNDTFGHQVGDDVLIQVAEVLKSSIRKTDIAARWGGEELAVYLPDTMQDTAMEVAERIRFRIQEQTNPPVTISLGVAGWTLTEIAETVESLFGSADGVLYEAKNKGRNQVRVATQK